MVFFLDLIIIRFFMSGKALLHNQPCCDSTAVL